MDLTSKTKLVDASRLGFIEVVKGLIEGQQINSDDDVFDDAFLTACENNQNEIVKYFLSKPTKTENLSFKKAMTISCEQQNLELVRSLFAASLLPSSRIRFSALFQFSSCLHIAARNGNLQILMYLIDRGCDMNHVNYAEVTPIYVACKFGKLNLVKYLIEMKCKVDASSLIQSMQSDNLEIVQFLVENGGMNFRDQSEEDLLTIAVKKGHVETFKYLVEIGFRDALSKSFLIACEKGFLSIVKYLIENLGIDFSKPIHNETKENGFLIACRLGQLSIVKYLISIGCCFSKDGNSENQIAFWIACESQRIRVAKYLISIGFDWDEKKEEIAWSAARNNHFEMFKFLIDYGCQSWEAKDFEEREFIQEAIYSGCWENLRYLVEVIGCDPKLCTSDGRKSMLYVATKRNHIEITKYFVEYLRYDISKDDVSYLLDYEKECRKCGHGTNNSAIEYLREQFVLQFRSAKKEIEDLKRKYTVQDELELKYLRKQFKSHLTSANQDIEKLKNENEVLKRKYEELLLKSNAQESEGVKKRKIK